LVTKLVYGTVQAQKRVVKYDDPSFCEDEWTEEEMNQGMDYVSEAAPSSM